MFMKPMKLFALNGVSLARLLRPALGRRWRLMRNVNLRTASTRPGPSEAVAGADVYVIHSLYGGPIQSANANYAAFCFSSGALKDAGSARVTAVTRSLRLRAQGQVDQALDLVTTRYVASMFEANCTDAVVTLEVHNPAAFENAFRCRTVALRARRSSPPTSKRSQPMAFASFLPILEARTR